MELFILFTALQLGDIYTTHTALKQGGRELNPVLAYLFGKFGHMPVLVVSKVIAVSLVYLYVLNVPIILGILSALYVYVVFNNYKQIRK
ncbi:MAG TPA: hypothetical protein DEP47_05530 [Chloroflexi bacterium]|nr:hypothetical protein [Chloroflexota bacterium]